jgi:hypothetical protein
MNPTLFWALNFLVLAVVSAIPWLFGDWVRPKLEPIVVHDENFFLIHQKSRSCFLLIYLSSRHRNEKFIY